MENQVTTIPADTLTGDMQPFELGKWLGRHQAFGLIASKCSAADAYALRVIRDGKLYKQLNLSWKAFCTLHAGMCEKTADKIIERQQEFGDTYFVLSQIVPIRPSDYRELAPSIENNTVLMDGERIPINREKTVELLQAVESLRENVRRRERDLNVARQNNRADLLWERFDACRNEFGACAEGKLEPEKRAMFIDLLNHVQAGIERIEAHLGLNLPAKHPG